MCNMQVIIQGSHTILWKSRNFLRLCLPVLQMKNPCKLFMHMNAELRSQLNFDMTVKSCASNTPKCYPHMCARAVWREIEHYNVTVPRYWWSSGLEPGWWLWLIASLAKNNPYYPLDRPTREHKTRSACEKPQWAWWCDAVLLKPMR